ncbi:RidA family protein [Anaerovoracaceae bacterium 41-7]|jgi:enamine deaminase RidA (YjgF/YER057c/UK114 family)|uniref:RidA family protein n=1 Tax=Anaerotruncus colihominis TaxID=169435 RepID=A0A845QMZ2_9FIRM|nr:MULTISPECIES: RidA family protein [Clostridia]MCI9475624.1 RidA family protein [Emergencia sp.]MCI9639986.1 RidA family protein [Emergencia sp.]NBH62067.1 RidA family protein [Anaerotruncus colihominis]NCF00545.1 RidA family protein [Emergencia sp. 1XD21-10]NCF02722.1 RidA family protein [Anaerotruncus sp. 80]
MEIERKIEQAGIKLPETSKSDMIFVPVRQVGNCLFTSGQIPFANGKPVATGKVGDEVSLEEAQEAARCCTVNMLGAMKAYLGDLDKVKRIVKIQVYVSSKTGFSEQHIVANAASQLLYDIFGELGKHVRTAVGVNQLPMDVPVEVEAIVEI